MASGSDSRPLRPFSDIHLVPRTRHTLRIKDPDAVAVAPKVDLPAPFARSRDGFVGYLRVECGLAPASIASYQRDLRDLFVDLIEAGVPSPEEATSRNLVAHMQSLKRDKKMQASSVARHRATIRVYYRWLLIQNRLIENPADLLERPTTWKRVPGTLSPGQVQRLIAAASPRNSPKASTRADKEQPALWIRDRALLELIYSSGLRASEVGTVCVSDFVIDRRTKAGSIRVVGKGGKHRLVPVGDPARDALNDYIKDCRAKLLKGDGKDLGRIFLSVRGRPLERVAIWQLVKRYARLAGLHNVHPHTLRHSFATHLVSGGADLRVVQELLGHADIGTTEIYTHLDRSRLHAMVERIHPRNRIALAGDRDW